MTERMYGMLHDEDETGCGSGDDGMPELYGTRMNASDKRSYSANVENEHVNRDDVGKVCDEEWMDLDMSDADFRSEMRKEMLEMRKTMKEQASIKAELECKLEFIENERIAALDRARVFEDKFREMSIHFETPLTMTDKTDGCHSDWNTPLSGRDTAQSKTNSNVLVTSRDRLSTHTFKVNGEKDKQAQMYGSRHKLEAHDVPYTYDTLSPRDRVAPNKNRFEDVRAKYREESGSLSSYSNIKIEKFDGCTPWEDYLSGKKKKIIIIIIILTITIGFPNQLRWFRNPKYSCKQRSTGFEPMAE